MENFETQIKDDFTELLIDKKNKILMSKRFGYPTEEKVKKSLENSLELIEKYSITKIITDLRQVKGTWTMATDWVAQNWFPRAIKAGLKYIAYIYPPDVFGQFSLKNLIKKSENYTLQVFKDLNKAYDWLISI